MIEFQHRQISLPDGILTIVCRIKGSIDGTTVYQFEDKLSKFLEQGFRRLIIVFSQVQYINSTGMGVLVKLADRSKDEAGDFCLVEVPDRIVGLFNVLGLLKLIKLFKTEDEAIKYFQPKKPGESVPQKTSQSTKSEIPAPPPPPSTSRFRPAPPAPTVGAKRNISPVEKTKSNLSTGNKDSDAQKKQPAGTKPKVFAILCKKCGKKIALGSSLVEGTYKCPLCLATFKIISGGKIQFL